MDKKELIGAIIDRMEDLLEKVCGSEEAVIEGADYDWLSGQIEEILVWWNVLPDEKTWHTESWCDQDIIEALKKQEIEATSENLEKVKELVVPLFDDKSQRKEQIADVVSQLFDNQKEKSIA